MAELKISSAQYGDMTNIVKDITIETRTTEGPKDQEETEYLNTKWSTWFGYYKLIPEVKTAIDMRAIWTLGRGFTADPETTAILDHISGWGNDTFNSVLKNMMVCKRIGGDAFAEVIRDEKSEILLNLKPLDPGSIKIVVNRQGRIKRYEQITRIKGENKKFEPKEIFHLINKRVGDEIHGVSDIEAIEQIILANNESFVDIKKMQHRFVKPIMKFMLDTDDTTKISAYAEKMDKCVNLGENIYLPKGTVEHEIVSVPANATLNPLPWREHLKNYFFQVVGIPQIILGSSGEFTESTAKIAYLAFEQSVEDEQKDIEEQVWHQLGLRIELSFPASLRNEMLSDVSKDTGQLNTQINPAGMKE
jgi:hypothetical protein